MQAIRCDLPMLSDRFAFTPQRPRSLVRWRRGDIDLGTVAGTCVLRLLAGGPPIHGTPTVPDSIPFPISDLHRQSAAAPVLLAPPVRRSVASPNGVPLAHSRWPGPLKFCISLIILPGCKTSVDLATITLYRLLISTRSQWQLPSVALPRMPS